METLVSIITPCYNSEKTIEKTIKSVLNQSYKNIEYIIIDGASTDNTLNIIEKYVPFFDGRIQVVSEKDEGIYDAMNKGINMAVGELIGIVNSDDYYEPDAVEIMVNNMDDVPYQVVYGMLRYIKQGMEEKVVLYNHQYIRQQMITHPTCFISKKAYEDFGLYNCNYKSCADYELLLRWNSNKLIKFKPIYHVISNFEVGGMSNSDYAVREGARLRLQYGLIRKATYYRVVFNSFLHAMYTKLLKK